MSPGRGWEGSRVGKIVAVLETASLEATFFLIACYIYATRTSLALHGWLTKAAMILLAILGIAIHGITE
ncbi:MAG: hypothetical protein BA066_03160 [Candidatus Korarchaeota archaeon NZ13-K]|nr:MAG: hypothetical protein BA066_03160 [Candidatus Korarchaeota archaeon NZ13-K]